MKKLSQEEFVEKALSRSKRPVDLSEFKYQGSASKSKAICPSHGQFQISANALMNRIGCPECALKERSSKRRMSASEFVEKAKIVHGDTYDYTNVIYTSAHAKVSIICRAHGTFEQGANSHLTGRGCPKCGNARAGQSCRLDGSEYLARAVAVHGTSYDLSRISFDGMSKKIEVICRSHGSFFPTASNFVSLGSGCPVCARANTGMKTRKHEARYITEAVKVHGGQYTYGKVIYKNNAAYLTVFCKDHGKFSQLAQDHLGGSGCEKCARPTFDQASFTANATARHGGIYDYSDSSYTGTVNKVRILCPVHGEFLQTPNMHVNEGQGCPSCARVGPSRGQLEIAELLRPFTEVEVGVKFGRKEVDILLPSLGIAIEFHGLIWHSTKFQPDTTRDYKKHVMLAELGVRLIHIYQDEWEFRKLQTQRLLLSAIGVSPASYYARSLSISTIAESDAAAFYDKYHIQGAVGAPCTSVALYQGTKPVAVMSFSRVVSKRGTLGSNEECELRRYATENRVVGGASRLLSYFLSSAPSCNTVISYSDNRLFAGGMYEKLGFIKDFVSKPSYCYTTGNASDGRLPKGRFKRSALASMPGFSFNPALSERENCEINGYYQVYDCGKTRWVFRR